ncbi:GlcG/HbpS family heme-binding protein [Rhodovibrionaceae bacterium A322]
MKLSLSKRAKGLCAATALALTASLSGGAVAEEESAIVTYQSLSPSFALKVAQATLENCRDGGYQIAVSVVDRGGNLQVTLRDRYAGAHTPDTAYRKAWTAISFRTETLDLAKVTEKGEAWAIRNITMALPLGGGVRILSGDGAMLGAVGVSGAPSGEIDQACAEAGIASIEEDIAF